jgi:hypothetical protein
MIKFQDLKEIHNKASIMNENSNCFDEIINNEKITEIVKGEGFSRTDVLDILEKLHIEYTNTNSKKILTMYKCFKYIFNYFQYESNYTNDKNKIITAYSYALKIIEKNNILGLEPSHDDKIQCLFKSIEYFRKKGIKIKIVNGKISCNESAKIARSIDLKLASLGIWGIIQLISIINKWEDTEIYKYIDASKSMITPIGYIFNKALKHLNPPMISIERSEKIFRDVVEISSHYISLYSIQKYGFSQLQFIYSSPSSMIDLLSQQAIADQVFKIGQYDASSIFSFIEFVNDQYDFIEIKILKDIAKYVLDCPLNIPITLNQELSKISDQYDKSVFEEILSLLTHTNVNSEFITVNDLLKINYTKKPFLKNLKGIIFLNHNFFYVGFYNVLFKILYSKNKARDQGSLIEKFAEYQLAHTNDSFIEGEKKYKVSKSMRNSLNISAQELESDMIVFNEKSIAFFEIKLRELVPESRSGNPYFILDDLTQSLIRSQTQLNKHLRYLTQSKKIHFESNQVLEYKDEDIFKISVSSLDFFGLSSRLVYINFLKSIINLKLDFNEKFQKEVSFINKHLNNFSEEIQKNEKIEDILTGSAFHNTAYLNVFQLIFLIHRSKSKNKSLIDEIMKTRSILLDQTDFYYYYKYFD